MKLVIEIARKEYERAKKGEWNCTIINKAVANATPLEKVFEEIKEEIQKVHDLHFENNQEGLSMFIDCEIMPIIDSHISGKEQE